MRAITAVALATTILASAAAHAGSGGVVTKIRSNDPAYGSNCVTFLTANDATRYGFSLRDPGSAQALVTLNAARQLNPGPTFLTGDPGPGFNPTDCAAPVVYVYGLER